MSAAGQLAMLPRSMRVRRFIRENHDTFTLELDPGEPFVFRPGQFNMLHVPGVGESAISISGDAAKPEVLVHTIREVGDVTRHLGRLRPGDELGVRGPFGVGWPVERALGQDLVIVAGGIGLAPLRPVLYYAQKHTRVIRNVFLAYGARSPKDMLFAKDLKRFQRRGLNVAATVDRWGEGWTGRIGVVTKLLENMPYEPRSTIAMVCGPEVMIRFTARVLEQVGMQSSDIWVTLERNMKCGVGTCGHCQLGSVLLCRDGPVVPYPKAAPLLNVREL